MLKDKWIRDGGRNGKYKENDMYKKKSWKTKKHYFLVYNEGCFFIFFNQKKLIIKSTMRDAVAELNLNYID
jgi:hypothetical protein